MIHVGYWLGERGTSGQALDELIGFYLIHPWVIYSMLSDHFDASSFVFFQTLFSSKLSAPPYSLDEGLIKVVNLIADEK
jgi:hypothetical protein